MQFETFIAILTGAGVVAVLACDIIVGYRRD